MVPEKLSKCLAREYGVAIRFADLGQWTEGQLLSEYDPTVPEVRINSNVAGKLAATELERFVAMAIGHELYHHREYIGEIAMLPARAARENAADAYARELLNRS